MLLIESTGGGGGADGYPKWVVRIPQGPIQKRSVSRGATILTNGGLYRHHCSVHTRYGYGSGDVVVGWRRGTKINHITTATTTVVVIVSSIDVNHNCGRCGIVGDVSATTCLMMAAT